MDLASGLRGGACRRQRSSAGQGVAAQEVTSRGRDGAAGNTVSACRWGSFSDAGEVVSGVAVPVGTRGEGRSARIRGDLLPWSPPRHHQVVTGEVRGRSGAGSLKRNAGN